MKSQVTVSTNYNAIDVTDTNIQASNCTESDQSINVVEEKKGKYYVAAVVSSTIKVFFVDSGADLSCCNEDLAKYGERKILRKPIKIQSYDEESHQTVTESVIIRLHFGPVIAHLRFYVCNTRQNIIGCDLLRNNDVRISLNTFNEIMCIGNFRFLTMPTEDEAIEELERRRKLHKEKLTSSQNNRGRNWARVTVNCLLKPHSVANVVLKTDHELSPEKEYVFISLFDEDVDDQIGIPCVKIGKNNGKFMIPVENLSGSDYGLKAKTALGEVKVCGDKLDKYTVLAFDQEEMDEAMRDVFTYTNASATVEENINDSKEKKNENKTTQNAMAPDAMALNGAESETGAEGANEGRRRKSNLRTKEGGKEGRPPENKTVHFEETSKVEGERTPNDPDNCKPTPIKITDPNEKVSYEDGPIKFTELINRNKVPPEALTKCMKDGIEIDLDLNVPEAEIGINEDPVDIEEERRRNRKCPYWPSREEFLKNFDFSTVEHEYLEEVKQLLWDFRGTFFNEDKPEMFRKGINMAPIEIKMKKGMEPTKRHPPRRMNEEKLKHLKEHIKLMLQRGVIEELKDGADGAYINPLLIVIEERFLASLGTTKKKSRFVLDLSFLNSCAATVQYPLPYSADFIASISKPPFKVFTNVDFVSMFYQMNITEKCARKYFAFQCLNRTFYLKRMVMGFSGAPSYCQAMLERCFRSAPNSHGFIDDVTTKSETQEAHVRRDLPLMLAICSKYNLLISPKKVDLMKDNVRVLGFQLSQCSKAIANEKKEKIQNMEFPTTKKEALSKSAFFAYFIGVAPRLSELMTSLRRLAHPKVRFKPTQADRDKFEELKSYLLNERVGVLRTACQDPKTLTIIFCDASSTSIGCVATQMLPPLPESGLDPTKKYLSIVACWSKKIDENWNSYPIWVLELCALEESTHKLSYLLSGRCFYCVTDSSTVRAWSSLEIVPKDIARKIIRLQNYNYRIIFCESRLNPSDFLTRWNEDEKPICKFPRFLSKRIITPTGEEIPWEKLFSKVQAKEAEKFFNLKRKQEMAHAVDPEMTIEYNKKETELDMKHFREAMMDENEDSENNSHEKGEESSNESRKKKKKQTKQNAKQTNKNDIDVKSINSIIAAYTLTDEEVRAGVDELLEEPPLDADAAETVELDEFKGNRLKSIRDLQNDDNIQKIKEIIINNDPAPDKTAALILSPELKHYYKNKSLFKLNKENILLRLWIDANGQMDQLIVVGEKQFHDIVDKTHKCLASSHQHAGQRRTFESLRRRYFSFHMRKTIASIINKCPTCQLNKHHKSCATDKGNKIAIEPNAEAEIDLCGPLSSWAKTAAGNPRYIYLYIDSHTRFLITHVLSSTADEQIYQAILHTRNTLCGLPARLQMDNAICKPNSKTQQFLRDHGVEISHGLPYVSRCQSRVERAINSLVRQICVLQTQHPRTPFTRLVADATFILNSTPSTSLGNKERLYCPRDLHFAKCPTDFLHHRGEVREIEDLGASARTASQVTLVNDVLRHLRRKKKSSPTDYNKILKPNQICLKKKMVFPTGSARKLGYKTLFQVLKVKSRVATNNYRCIDLRTNEELIVGGDTLIKLSLTAPEAVKLSEEMENMAGREFVTNHLRIDDESAPEMQELLVRRPIDASNDMPVAETRRSNRIRTREERARQSAAVSCIDMRSLFKE